MLRGVMMKLFRLIMFVLYVFRNAECELEGDDEDEEVIVVVMAKCNYATSQDYCNRMGGELADRSSVEIYQDCIVNTQGTGRGSMKRYWIEEEDNCGSGSVGLMFCTVEISRRNGLRFNYRRSSRDFYSLCKVDRSDYREIPEISTTLCPAATPIRTTSSSVPTTTNSAYRSVNMTSSTDVYVTSDVSFWITATSRKQNVTTLSETEEPGTVTVMSTGRSDDGGQSSEKILDNSKGHIVVTVIVVAISLLLAIGAALIFITTKRINQKRNKEPKFAFHNKNYMNPDERIPSSATDSNKYLILEESTYSEVKEDETENVAKNNSRSNNQNDYRHTIKETTYSHLESNKNESRHDVTDEMYSHLDGDNKASYGVLNHGDQGNVEGNYDHLEGKKRPSHGNDLSEYSMETDQTYTDLRGAKSSVDPNPEYDHTDFCKGSEERNETQYDHTNLTSTVDNGLQQNDKYEHLTVNI